MTEELRDLEAELEKLCQDIRKGIDGLVKLKAAEKTNKVSYLQGRISRAKQVYRNFKLEMRDLSKVDQDPWNKKAKDFMDQINKLSSDLNWTGEDKAALMGNGETPATQDPDSMTTKQILEKGDKIQKTDINALDNVLQTIEQTKETGVEIGNRLGQQTEQLQKTIEGVQEVQNYLKIASKELRAFARRVATDKLIMSFICLIVVGIIFVIIWESVKGNKAKAKVDGSVGATTGVQATTTSTTGI